jgi:putative transposase
VFSISRIQQLMKGLSRGQFDRLVRDSAADKHSKGFGSWDQLLAMVYAQLSGAQSLRQLEAGFNSAVAHHYHLGTEVLRRSTLADANARRSPAVFAAAARLLMGQIGRSARQEAAQLLYLLDSTSITLEGRGFDAWTQANATRHTQGIKLHLLYGADSQTPAWHSFSPANVNDITAALELRIEPGATYVFDKGYCDYNWWARIDAAGARFVTRFKRNAALRVHEARPIEPAAAGVVLADEIVGFAKLTPRGGHRNTYTQSLRRIELARAGHATSMVLATNDLDTPALDIARRYKDRWQVELFFKWIKQHLRVKRFFGRSENAVRIQILTALIAYLLLALYRKAHGLSASLWSVLGELRANLFQRPNIERERYQRRRERLREISSRQSALFA